MKKRVVKSLPKIAMLILGVCSFSVAGLAQVNLPQSSEDTANQIRVLKKQIMDIARSNTYNSPEELPFTREALEPLVQQLNELSSVPPVSIQVGLVEGSWKEIWSDDREPSRPGVTLNRNSVYQVVTKSGYFYNIGTIRGVLPSGQKVEFTGFLRGVYTQDLMTNGLQIQFTRLGYLDGQLPAQTQLFDTIIKAETDSSFLKSFPGDVTAPRGPVGQKGFLQNVYVDGDIRIARGFNYADNQQDLYILRKVTEVEMD